MRVGAGVVAAFVVVTCANACAGGRPPNANGTFAPRGPELGDETITVDRCDMDDWRLFRFTASADPSRMIRVAFADDNAKERGESILETEQPLHLRILGVRAYHLTAGETGVVTFKSGECVVDEADLHARLSSEFRLRTIYSGTLSFHCGDQQLRARVSLSDCYFL